MRISDLDQGAAALASSEDLFTSPAWLAVIAETYGFPIHVAAAEREGALPFAALDDLMGRRLIAVPFSDYAAPPADGGHRAHAPRPRRPTFSRPFAAHPHHL